MNLKEQNILFFSRSNIHGGTENVILQLCEIFQPLVNKIVVCTAEGFSSIKLAELNIQHYIIPDIEDKRIGTIIKVSKALKDIVLRENITVIHTHHRMAAFYVSMLRLYKDRYFFNTSHNTFTNKKMFTRFAYKHAQLIACGDMVKKNLVEVFGFTDVIVIHNAVKPFQGKLTEDLFIKNLHNDGSFVVANVGRLSEQKGMEYYIKAIQSVIQQHIEAKFLIIGSGEEEAKLVRLSESLGLTNNLFFLGYREDVQNILAQVDLVVLSSLWEGLPLTPIEAFSVGKTIVATAVDGTVEIVEDGKNGLLVDPQNVDQLSEKICWMIENDKSQLEKNALNTFENKFSFQVLQQKYIDAYEQCKR